MECGGVGSSGTPVTIYFAQSCSRKRTRGTAATHHRQYWTGEQPKWCILSHRLRAGVCMSLQGDVRSEQGYISGVLVIKRVRNQGMSLFATVAIS